MYERKSLHNPKTSINGSKQIFEERFKIDIKKIRILKRNQNLYIDNTTESKFQPNFIKKDVTQFYPSRGNDSNYPSRGRLSLSSDFRVTRYKSICGNSFGSKNKYF